MSTKCLSEPLLLDLKVDRSSQIVLNDLRVGEKGTVCLVPEVELLSALGIRVGKRVQVMARSIAGGPILVRVDRRTVAIDRTIASQIMLRSEGHDDT